MKVLHTYYLQATKTKKNKFDVVLLEDVLEIEKKVRAIIWRIAQEEGGQILHYNEKLDEIFETHLIGSKNGGEIK